MRRQRARSIGALLAAVGLGLAGCAGDAAERPDPTASASLRAKAECAAAVSSMVHATQRYVDGFARASAVAAPAASNAGAAPTAQPTVAPAVTSSTDAEFQAALVSAQQVIADSRCATEQLRADLQAGLSGVTAQGAVSAAVLRQVTASMTGRLAPAAATREVAPGDDLAQVLAELPEGSTVVLAAGEYALSDPLVLLTGVALRGVGRGRTTIVSTAPEAAVLVLTGGRVELRDLAIRRTGDAAGSVVLGGPASSVVVSGVRFAGGRTNADGQGGAGILMYASGTEGSGRGTTIEVTDAELADNEAAGIVLTGGHRASVVSSDFHGNGQCGICFLGASDGSVENSTFTKNGVGVAVSGSSRPTVVGSAFTRGEVGVQVSETAAPGLDGNVFSGSRRAAMIYTGSAGGRVDHTTCENVPFGIVVGPDAHPDLGDNDCALASGDDSMAGK